MTNKFKNISSRKVCVYVGGGGGGGGRVCVTWEGGGVVCGCISHLSWSRERSGTSTMSTAFQESKLSYFNLFIFTYYCVICIWHISNNMVHHQREKLWCVLEKNNRTNAEKNQLPRAGIEPTTHRFHDWRSTTELPSQLQWDGQSLNITIVFYVFKFFETFYCKRKRLTCMYAVKLRV